MVILNYTSAHLSNQLKCKNRRQIKNHSITLRNRSIVTIANDKNV